MDRALRRNLAKSVSVTTRPRRSGECQGRDYFFLNPGEFLRLKKNKKILEWTRYLGYYYGTKKDILDGRLTQGKHLALCLDLKGALRLKKLYPDSAITIFVQPPSIKELRKRIAGRCVKTKCEEINKRLALAELELKNYRRYDYVLKNKNLSQAVNRLKGIILKEIGS